MYEGEGGTGGGTRSSVLKRTVHISFTRDTHLCNRLSSPVTVRTAATLPLAGESDVASTLAGVPASLAQSA